MKHWFHFNQALFFTVCVFSFFTAHSALAFSLRHAVSEALHSNPKLQASAQELEESRQRVRQAFAGYLPTVDLALGSGREWVNTPSTRALNNGGLTLDRGEAGLNFKQPIFDGFNTPYKVEQAEAKVRAADFNYTDVAETLTLDVAENYLETQKQRKLLELATASMTLHTEILIKTRRSAQLGISADMDVRQSESRLALIASELASTEGTLRTANTRFTSLVGFPPGALAQPTLHSESLPTTKARALTHAMAHNPALLAAAANLEATRAEGKADAASLWPKISLDLAVSDNTNASGSRSYSYDASAMLRLKYNLFKGGTDLSKFKENSHKAVRFQEIVEQTRKQVEDKVNQAWNGLIASRTRLQSLNRHVEVTQRVNLDHHDQFKLGTQSLLDLLNSENELYAAKRLLVEEEFRFMTESYRLLAAMGKLKESLLKPEKEPNPTKLADSPTHPTTPLSRVVVSTLPTPTMNLSINPISPELPEDSTPTNPVSPKMAPRRDPTHNPLSQAQDEAMQLLVATLFKDDLTQRASTTNLTPPTLTDETIPFVTPAEEEALSALTATVNSSSRLISQQTSSAVRSLTQTIKNSMAETPKPAATKVPPVESSQNKSSDWPVKLWENELEVPSDLDQMPLLDYIQLMTNDESEATNPYPTTDSLQYTIQVGAFLSKQSAVNLIKLLQAKGYALYLQKKQENQQDPWYLVWLGRYETANLARQALQLFRSKEFLPAFIIPVARAESSSHTQPLSATLPQTQTITAPPRPESSSVVSPKGYAVQVGELLNPDELEIKLVELSNKGYKLALCTAKDHRGEKRQWIWIERPYPTQAQAQAAAQSFIEREQEDAVVVEINPDNPTNPQIITQVGNPA